MTPASPRSADALPAHRALVRFLDLDGPENDGRLSFAKGMTVATFVVGAVRLESGFLLTLLIFTLAAAHGRSVLLRALARWQGSVSGTVSDIRQRVEHVVQQIRERRAAADGEFEETRTR